MAFLWDLSSFIFYKSVQKRNPLNDTSQLWGSSRNGFLFLRFVMVAAAIHGKADFRMKAKD